MIPLKTANWNYQVRHSSSKSKSNAYITSATSKANPPESKQGDGLWNEKGKVREMKSKITFFYKHVCTISNLPYLQLASPPVDMQREKSFLFFCFHVEQNKIEFLSE